MMTKPGATAVQVEHLGSAHDDTELEALKAAARQRMAADELGLGLEASGPSGPLLMITIVIRV